MNPPLSSTLAEIGEKALLRHLYGRIPAAPGVLVGVGDDAAAVEIGPAALLTTDSLVEGVHFERATAPPRLLGRKALTVNLSDVAAMGGIGRYATVALCLPPELTLEWVDSLYDGLLERAAESGVALVGGNVTRGHESIVVDVTLLGDSGRLLRRVGARPGDRVMVTGTLGAAAEGVRLLAEGARLDEDGELAATGVWTESSAPAVLACLRAQLDPRPPLALARSVAERGIARAGMDVSDGLSLDLVEICARSGVGAVIEAAAVPVDPKAAGLERARGGDALALALHGGEDYQLLFAVSPEGLEDVGELARVWGVEVAAIGEFVAGEPAVRIRDGEGERPLAPGGHDHFRTGLP
ncbi:MAG TPA: thiamine-phosphate kinase [Vicinamibacteria bacterium]|nr:thiamine-phosphate kinase [Vicinamibacteria bacterium]